MKVKVVLDTRPALGKVAEAELHFEESDGALSGLKLVGFSVWERRTNRGEFNVTFPARQYQVNGERRSFALLRPLSDVQSQETIRALIIAAYKVEAGYLPASVAPEGWQVAG